MSRDFQRRKVYQAENATFGRDCPRFDSLDAVALFLQREVFDRAWYWRAVEREELRGLTGVKLTPGKGRTSACYRLGTIHLPEWARTPWVVLHELAHGIRMPILDANTMTGIQQRREVASHGPAFCRAYLLLVRHVLGPEMERTLKFNMKQRKVRFGKPRKLPSSVRIRLSKAARERFWRF